MIVTNKFKMNLLTLCLLGCLFSFSSSALSLNPGVASDVKILGADGNAIDSTEFWATGLFSTKVNEEETVLEVRLPAGSTSPVYFLTNYNGETYFTSARPGNPAPVLVMEINKNGKNTGQLKRDKVSLEIVAETINKIGIDGNANLKMIGFKPMAGILENFSDIVKFFNADVNDYLKTTPYPISFDNSVLVPHFMNRIKLQVGRIIIKELNHFLKQQRLKDIKDEKIIEVMTNYFERSGKEKALKESVEEALVLLFDHFKAEIENKKLRKSCLLFQPTMDLYLANFGDEQEITNLDLGQKIHKAIFDLSKLDSFKQFNKNNGSEEDNVYFEIINKFFINQNIINMFGELTTEPINIKNEINGRNGMSKTFDEMRKSIYELIDFDFENFMGSELLEPTKNYYGYYLKDIQAKFLGGTSELWTNINANIPYIQQLFQVNNGMFDLYKDFRNYSIPVDEYIDVNLFTSSRRIII